MPTNEATMLLSLIDRLETSIATLAVTEDLRQMRSLMHQPGWTTTAEQTFVLTILSTLQEQLHTVEVLREGLLAASKQVGTID
jgi:hypothetical protein